MNKKSKITLAALSTLVVVALVLVIVNLVGKDTSVSGTYAHESSLRWHKTVEEIVIDGKNEDDCWKGINPYIRETNSENRDAKKYKVFESKIQECKAEVYTYFGEEGLFLYAITDEPVVNKTVLDPFSTTAFDFYVCDQAALNRIDNLFNFAISADNNVKLRVRGKDVKTGKETWLTCPTIGVKSETVVYDKGYSVEIYIPWTTLNIEEKPEYLQLGTALSRRLDETETSDRFWEMFDYYTQSISLTNTSTFPLFDKTGYLEFAQGENFAPLHSNIIDFSEDKGDKPKVTTLNRNTVTAYLDKDAVKDVYWETKIQITDFNYTDDPRVGIVLSGEKREDGTYDRVFLLFQLDKKHEGEGYTINNIIMLPHSNGKNNWKDAQYFNLNSHIKNKEFEVAILKQDGKFSFYLDDVLLCERTEIENFNADTKVSCGITSWFVGATFSEYSMQTTNFNAIKAKKAATYVADENYRPIMFDLLTQSKGYIWAYSQSTNQSTVNFNKSVSGTFNATTTISDLKAYKDAKDSRQGIVITKDKGASGYGRIFIMLTGGENGNFKNLQIMALDNDEFGDKWSKVTWIDNISIGTRIKAELSVSSIDNNVTVYIDGKYTTGFSLNDYNMQNPNKVGLSSWKGTAKFSDNSLISEAKDINTITTDVSMSKSVLQISKEASADIYAETLIKVSDSSTTMWPRAGLRITNTAGNNIDYFLCFNKEKELTSVKAVLVDADGNDIGKQQTYFIDSALSDVSKDGIKLHVAKIGETFYFYVNDVLMGTKVYEGFGKEDKVTANLYSKATTSTFSNYGVKTDKPEIYATTEKLTDIFVADEKKKTIYFDLLNEADGVVSTNENGTWKDSSIVNWYGLSDSKFYVETIVKLDKSHAKGSANGIVLTEGEHRFFVLLGGNEVGITGINCFSMYGDVMDSYNAEKYPTGKVNEYSKSVSLSKENKLAIYRDKGFLYILVNDELVTSVDLTTVKYPILGNTTIGLTAWKAQSTFTDYEVKLQENCPILSTLTANTDVTGWEIVGGYNKEKNTISIEAITSNKNLTTHAFMLEEAQETELYVETIIKTSAVNKKYWPRTGIRLTNEDGTNVDFVIAFKKEDTPTFAGLYAIQTNVKGEDISGTKQVYDVDNSVKQAISTTGVKLAIAKRGGTLYFFINDVLYGTKDYAGFGADNKVTAYLYSKVTQTIFSDYRVSQHLQSDIGKGTDVVALYVEPRASIHAETMVKVSDTSTKYWPRVGLRFTNQAGNHIDFFVAYDKEKNVTSVKVAPVTNNTDGKVTTYLLSEQLKTAASTTGIKLSATKMGSIFYFYINDVLQGSMSYDGFGTSDKVTAQLYSKYTEASFFDYEYSIPAGVTTDKTKSNDVTPLLATASTDFYVEAKVKTTEASTSVWPRVGLRITNGSKTNVDFVVAFKKNATPTYEGTIVVQTSESGSDISGSKVSFSSVVDKAVLEKIATTDVKLAAAKKGGVLYFFINDVMIGTKSYADFGANEKVTVSMYSKGTTSSFSDYSAATPGNSLAYVGDVFATAKAKNVLKVVNGVADVDIQINGRKSSEHGYQYFKEKSTKIYAETYIDFTAATSNDNQRAGIVLTNADKNAQLGIYLFAQNGTSGVTKLQIYALSGFANGWGTSAANIDLTQIAGLENIGRTRIKLSVLRDGDTYTVCVNDIVACTRKLSALSNFNIKESTETYIGVIGMQQSATFYDYSYQYGNAVGK